jgi:hypothetical protein
MKIGIGKAMHMPADPKFLGRYEAISESKVWCGNTACPRGKVNGTNPQCLSKGFGIGGKIKALGPRMGFGLDSKNPGLLRNLDELEKYLVDALQIIQWKTL